MESRHEAFIKGLPKAELHVHIEGTLTPAQKWAFARRNGIALPYESIAAIEAAQDYRGADAIAYLTVNTDDPGLFKSGTFGTMLPPVAAAGGFSEAELAQLMINAFDGAWLPRARRDVYIAEVRTFLAACNQTSTQTGN